MHAAFVVSDAWIQFGYAMRRLADRLDTSPELNIKFEALITNVDPTETPFGTFSVKHEQFERVTDDLKSNAPR